jgi:hypothetical protein
MTSIGHTSRSKGGLVSRVNPFAKTRCGRIFSAGNYRQKSFNNQTRSRLCSKWLARLARNGKIKG